MSDSRLDLQDTVLNKLVRLDAQKVGEGKHFGSDCPVLLRLLRCTLPGLCAALQCVAPWRPPIVAGLRADESLPKGSFIFYIVAMVRL